MAALLTIQDLSVGWGGREILREVSLELPERCTTALVGESGSGKTTLLRACLGMLPRGASVRGALRWSPAASEPMDLAGASAAQWRRLRGKAIAWIPQEPSAALDPRRSAAAHVRECLVARRRASRHEAKASVAAALAAVGIGAARGRDYPFEWSGGMQQRLLVAMALAREPRLLLADEPTSALDTLHQARLLGLLGRLQAERGFAMLWVTHDLAVAAAIAAQVYVLREGAIVEQGSAASVFRHPRHPYTQALVASQPRAQWAAAGRSGA